MAKKEYSKKEAAEILGTTPAAIQKRIERNRIEAFKNDQGQWRVVLDGEGKTGEKDVKPETKQETGTSEVKAVDEKKETPAEPAAPSAPPEKEESLPKSTPCSAHTMQSVKMGIMKEIQQEEDKKRDRLGGAFMSSNIVSTVTDLATDVKKKAEELTNFLVDKLEMQRDEAANLAEKIVEKGESQKNTYLFKLLESVETLRSKVVTRQDIERLEKKIEILNKKLEAKE